MKYLYLLSLLWLFGCQKDQRPVLNENLPEPPEFTVSPLAGDPNSFVVTSNTANVLSQVWDTGGGNPSTSKLITDTIFYKLKGTYTITLHATAKDGSGSSKSSKSVTVADDVAGCLLPFLYEDCTTKCWRLSGQPGGVKVGPIPYSGEWYTSPDITPTQADDKWCFQEDGNLKYLNNGSSFSSCQGFVEVPNYPIPANLKWTFEEGKGFDGLDQLKINGIWMGVEDTGPTYDIISINDNEMVVLTPIKPCDGTASTGWFTLTFYKAD